MAHSHEHHHEHVHELTSLNKSFIIGITLNILFVLVEFGIGFYYDSLGLLSDAGHNLGDVASLVLAMLAFRLAKVHPNSRYTYGYKKSTVLVSLLNAVILLVAVGIIITESIEKLFHPVPVEGAAIAWTAGVGVVINAVTAWLFMKDKEKDLNVKGAYLHMAADTLVSVGVVISGIIIMYTGWTLVDPIIGLVIAYFWFSSLNEGGSPKEVRQDGDGKKGIDALPNLMYSDGNVRWTLERREADFAIYRNDNGGTITIRNADVSGGQILSDAGHFQTYR